VKYIFKRDFEKYISEEYLFQYIYEKEYLIQICVFPEERYFSNGYFFLKYIFKRDFGKYIFCRIFVSIYF